jgi:hypothetical protein
MADLQAERFGTYGRHAGLFSERSEPSIALARPTTGRFWGGVVNNFSLLTADRMTHVKVVAVALVCAMVGIGLAARLSEESASGGARLEATVIKASKPITASAAEPRTIR